MLLSSLLQLHSSSDFQLVERVQQYSPIVIAGLVCCFALLSLARIKQGNVFLVLVYGILKFEEIEELNRKGIRENQVVGFMLNIQYIIVSSILVYVAFFYTQTTFSIIDFAIITIPTLFFLYQNIVLHLISSITKKQQLGGEINFLTSSLMQLAGLVLLVELVVIYFQSSLMPYCQWITLGTLLFFQTIRLFRGFFHALVEGVSWYYIILYLWTLEILPLLIAINILMKASNLGVR